MTSNDELNTQLKTLILKVDALAAAVHQRNAAETKPPEALRKKKRRLLKLLHDAIGSDTTWHRAAKIALILAEGTDGIAPPVGLESEVLQLKGMGCTATQGNIYYHLKPRK